MQPKNKKLIIILIVAAVAAYLLWKRKGTIVETETIAVSTGGLNPSDLEDVITAAQISNTQAALVREKASAAESMASLKNTIQEKATDKGNTYAQQVLFEAIYPVYHKKVDGAWVIKDATASTNWKAIVNRVKNM